MIIFWFRGIYFRWRLEFCIIRLYSKWMILRDYLYVVVWFFIDSLCFVICSVDEKEFGFFSWNKIDLYKLVGYF